MGGGEGSPVWDRSLSSPSGIEPCDEACVALRANLDRLGVARLVVGHTPQRQLNCACEGTVWRCDTGMSRWVANGACEALEITTEGGARIIRAGSTMSADAAAPIAECDTDGCHD